MGSRRKGRILAFQSLYAWDVADAADKERDLADLVTFPWLEDDKRALLGEAAEFSRLLVAGAVENIAAVDAMIRSHLAHWDFSRLTLVDRALLRLSVYELMFQDLPPSVVIDEAIDISREYGTTDSYRFINGVLDGVRKTVQNRGL
ncbi:MAG: transcription antitermination factor NusB [Spirochaetaceae bacterium]|jgi:N utilization substance protein B|nr:transcription antitermination factor NusB [Spirochaetaceae bacterium]